MNDPRVELLAKRGIKGLDASTSLATIDRVLARKDMKTWAQMSETMDLLVLQEAEVQYAISVFGHDACRAALALHAARWAG